MPVCSIDSDRVKEGGKKCQSTMLPFTISNALLCAVLMTEYWARPKRFAFILPEARLDFEFIYKTLAPVIDAKSTRAQTVPDLK